METCFLAKGNDTDGRNQNSNRRSPTRSRLVFTGDGIKVGVVVGVSHKLDGIVVGRIRTVPFSSHSAYDYDAHDSVKTTLS